MGADSLAAIEATAALELPRPSRLLRGADVILVGYCAGSVAIAAVAWQRDTATAWPMFWISALLVTNAVISWLPARRQHPLPVEGVRAAAGAVLAPAAYLSSTQPFGHWWPGFVLMALVGSFGVGLLSARPRLGRWFSAYYVTLFVVSAFIAPDVTLTRGWVVGGGIAIATAVAAELIVTLGAQLSVERTQRAQIQDLMHRVFPVSIAETLRVEGRVAEHHAEASILFADIVGFTSTGATLEPGELVTMLDEVFSALDDIVEELGLEKIKTIGDCYMVAAGVPDPVPDHAAGLCEFALRALELTGSRTFAGHRVQFRVGINTGPVVAGVVGQTRFLYDLWGDAVNVASRMESHARAGTVQISAVTHALVHDRFVCVDSGVIDVKGRGPMHVWQVTGRARREPAIDLTDALIGPATPGTS